VASTACSQGKKEDVKAPVGKSIPKKPASKQHVHEKTHESIEPAPVPTPPEPAPAPEPAPKPTPAPEPAPNPASQPKAVLIAPATVKIKSYVVLDFTGTVSSKEPDFDVAIHPEGSKSTVTKLYDDKRALIYGMLVPDKAGKYRIALVAFSTDSANEEVRVYAFADIEALENGKPTPPPGPLPNPNPPPSPGPGPLPNPNPSPVPADTYGMYTYTKDLLAKMPTTENWQVYVPLISDSFDKMIAQSSDFTDATRFVQATSDLYKKALGENYSYFSYHFFTPLKTQLAKINSSGKLPSTVDAHVEAWKEISKALKEIKPVSSTKRSSARSSH
jgi:hypothetical protein